MATTKRPLALDNGRAQQLQDGDGLSIGAELQFPAVTTPATPPSGAYKIYPKSDGKIYKLNDAGVESEVGAAGIDGAVFVSNIIPTGSGNVGSKVYSSDGMVLESCVSDTPLVTVSVLAITGHTNYKPVVTVNGAPVTLTGGSDKPLFTGTIAIDLGVGTTVTVVHEDGASHVTTVAVDTPPVISSAIFTGGYPGSQTQLKSNDSFQFRVVSDIPVTAVEFSDYGSFQAHVFTVSSGTDHTVTGTIANRGTSVQDLGARVRVQKSTGSWSTWHLTEADGSADGVNLVKLCNLYPSVSVGAITYPVSQSALKDSETADVANTASNYDVIAYDSQNGDISIASPSVFANPKTVTRIAGTYNIATANFRATATRSANAAVTIATGIVKIAHTSPTIDITVPASRLRSGGNDGTAAQDHTVTITSSQQLYQAPTLAAGSGGGTFQGAGFSGGPSVWTRALRVSDDDVKAGYSFNTLNAVNLAGKIVTTINSGASYTLGGFVSRAIALAAFANETHMHVAASDYMKVTLSWSFKTSLNIRAALDTSPPVVDSWCLAATGTNPVVIRVLDTAATDACSQESTITIQESV